VTGGARGLGAAIARAVAREGAVAAVADIREEQAQTLAAELAAEGLRAGALTMDVTDEASVVAGLDMVRDSHGRIDVVVNNAGIDLTLPIEEIDTARWLRVLHTNLYGPFLVAKMALPHLRERRGHIVNVASTAAKRAWPNASAYHASKWGLLGLSHALHAELRSHGVRVTALVAGGMRTPFLLERFPDIDPAVLQDPEDVARAVVFAITAPPGSVVAEIMVLPVRETSWP
jgi:NAD(P)-dependent dehydrogenase (short-subunit alcohol dehydrogenase family)